MQQATSPRRPVLALVVGCGLSVVSLALAIAGLLSWVGVLAVYLAPLLMVAAGVLLAVASARRPRRLQWLLPSAAIWLATATVLPTSLAFARYHHRMGLQPPGMAAALHWACEKYDGCLPDTIEELEANGWYGTLPYHLPTVGGGNDDTGPRPFYVPIKKWDDKTPFVVMLQPYQPLIGNRRGYAVLGDTRGKWASEAELERLLAEDDVRRAAADEPFRWSQVAWRR